MNQKNEFKDYVVEILSPYGNIRARSMFGGHGIYCNDAIVGIIVDETLFFKTNEQTKSRFVEKNCKPFEYERDDRRIQMSYYEVPSEAMDSSEGIAPWLRLAIAASSIKNPTSTSSKKR